MKTIDRLHLVPPGGGSAKVLLLSCCAPCSGAVIEALASSGVDTTVLFYNPNIHPEREYLQRKDENQRFASKLGVPFVDADYDPESWLARAKGMEHEPERGVRCTMCFDMRLARAALYAHENGFSVFSSTLGFSRWKNMDEVNACGHRAAAAYDGLTYWDVNWRKDGGSARGIALSKEEHFYQQLYCGCIYSLRDANARRREKGEDPIAAGETFYGEPTAPASGRSG